MTTIVMPIAPRRKYVMIFARKPFGRPQRRHLELLKRARPSGRG